MPFITLAEKDFFGRTEMLADLYRRALDTEKGIAWNAFLSGPRGIGKTELLKQLFHHMFWKQDAVAPFFYTVNDALLSAADFSRDYLTQYICQRLAFEKRDQSLLWLDGVSIADLSSLLVSEGAAWARDVLDRHIHSSGEPIDSLRVAFTAPLHSALSTGKPVVIMIDEFQRLRDLHTGGGADPRLVSLLEAPLSFKKTSYVMTGSDAEIQEMPLCGGFARVPIPPLGVPEASHLFLSVLRAHGLSIEAPPHMVIDHLGRNPFYVRCAATAAASGKTSGEADIWSAYYHEVSGGTMYLYWSSVLKKFFPELRARRDALEALRKLYHGEGPPPPQKTPKEFPWNDYPEAMLRAFHHAGLARGEFGVFRPPEDIVVKDFIDGLYMREILGKTSEEIERTFLARAPVAKKRGVSFELVLPMMKEAELVAAQSIEQIGKNWRINEEAVGQLQMAVIEACINAIEHSRGEERNIYVTFTVYENRLEASIESPGREFIVQETGEPLTGRTVREEPGRGWGIKLMKRLMDEVRFERTARGTRVILVKNLAKAADIPRAKEGAANSE